MMDKMLDQEGAEGFPAAWFRHKGYLEEADLLPLPTERLAMRTAYAPLLLLYAHRLYRRDRTLPEGRLWPCPGTGHSL